MVISSEWVGYGLFLVNALEVLIVNSSFANNGAESLVANTHIAYDHQLKTMPRVNIVKSNFTLGLGGGMVLFYGNDNEAKIIVENSTFSHNIAQYQGGAVYVALLGVGSIEFNNCTIYNNTVQQFDGGGVYISSHKNSSIVFCDCIIYNNIAQQFYGGGVYIDLYEGGGSIDFGNCTIYNNIAQSEGGGVYIDLYDGGGTIELHNCTIHDNAAYFGSGLFLHSLQIKSRAIFNFRNVLFHFNKARNKLAIYQKVYQSAFVLFNIVYQSAVVLFNIVNVTFDQIEISNHNTTG